jgi:capsular exopolysaccharide synthesis family protein
MDHSAGAQPDLRSVLDALWRRRWLFLGIFVSIPVVVYVVSTRIAEKWEASAIISSSTPTIDPAVVAGGALSATGSEDLLVITPKVKDAAAAELGGPPGGSVKVEPFESASGAETSYLRVTGTAGSGKRAADIANAYATAIDKVRTGESLNRIDRAMVKLRAQADAAKDATTEADLKDQLQNLGTSRAAVKKSTETVVPAEAPAEPISPNPERNTALAAVVALLLALGAVVVRERLDRRLRDPDELEPMLGTPLLSVVPRAAFPGAAPATTAAREAFRTLASSLVYFNIDRPLGTVMVASPTKGDGKTTVALYLALALAMDGQDVVLIDADLRHPQIGVRLGIEPKVGLSEVITHQGDVDDALVEVDVEDGRLRVLGAGSQPPNPARLLSSRRMGSLLAALSEQVDMVVIDTPPLLAVSDAVPLLERVSGTVLVAKVDSTSRDALRRMRQVIDTARGNVLGAVATGSGKSGLYGYGGYYYGAEDGRPGEREPIVDQRTAAGGVSDVGTAAGNGRGEAPGPGVPEREGAGSASEPTAQPEQGPRDSET